MLLFSLSFSRGTKAWGWGGIHGNSVNSKLRYKMESEVRGISLPTSGDEHNYVVRLGVLWFCVLCPTVVYLCEYSVKK